MTKSAYLRPASGWLAHPIPALAVPALAMVCLAGCGDYSADYPQLMPTDQVLAAPTLPAHARDAGESPQALETALTERAARAHRKGTTTPMPQDSDLAARAQALQSRAKALSQTETRADETVEDPACAANSTDCPVPSSP